MAWRDKSFFLLRAVSAALVVFGVGTFVGWLLWDRFFARLGVGLACLVPAA